MKKRIAATLVAAVMLVGLSATPANAWYVKGTAGCKAGTYAVQQYAWWSPMGVFGGIRWVCKKPGEHVPVIY